MCGGQIVVSMLLEEQVDTIEAYPVGAVLFAYCAAGTYFAYAPAREA
jgi:hypothetical protein